MKDEEISNNDSKLEDSKKFNNGFKLIDNK